MNILFEIGQNAVIALFRCFALVDRGLELASNA